MPVFRHDDVRPLGVAVMQAAGATREEAELIVDHHIDAILYGENEHGYPLGTQYIPDIESGIIKPGVAYTIEKETPTTLMVDGHFNFGHYVSHHVMQRLIAKAKTSMVAAASIRYQCHVGRLMDYTAMAAREGMVALMMCDGGWGPKFMAPTGGRDRRLGLNPWSIALPNDTGGIVGFDMTSSVASGSKVIAARQRGEVIPEGWIIDKDGKPSTDPNAFFDGGSFLPAGGIVAHKGYALCFMIEALADVLSGMEFREDSSRPWPILDGCFMAIFNVEAFRPLIDFKRDLSQFLDWVKSSRPAEGSSGVFYPGERSSRNRERAEREGIDIPQFIYERVLAYARRFDVDPKLFPQPLGPGRSDHISAPDDHLSKLLQKSGNR
ncbi:MAG TPA: Ldh family oxidoreductase [Casimicrobiaceae bacterium]|nr:Ldh family oxidoreductase [Casimicrobiaceae bacterium]